VNELERLRALRAAEAAGRANEGFLRIYDAGIRRLERQARGETGVDAEGLRTMIGRLRTELRTGRVR
jgi:hypothetical protein